MNAILIKIVKGTKNSNFHYPLTKIHKCLDFSKIKKDIEGGRIKDEELDYQAIRLPTSLTRTERAVGKYHS